MKRDFEDGFNAGWSAAAEKQKKCGHPVACIENESCTVCAEIDRLLAAGTANEDDENLWQRLIEVARAAASTAVPKETRDWLDGVQAGADIVIEALEKA